MEHDAAAHEAGRYEEIASRLDDVHGKLLPNQDIDRLLFGLAINFWDDWGDAANHEWQYHEPTTEEDWPRFARQIAACLRSGSMGAEDSDLERFMHPPGVGLMEKVKALWDKFR